MTELEQRLLNELEKLEEEREEYEKRLSEVSKRHADELQKLAKNMTEKYQAQLLTMVGNEQKGSKLLVGYLAELTEQQRRIIELLERPPKGEPLIEQLEEKLEEFSIKLVTRLKKVLEDTVSGK